MTLNLKLTTCTLFLMMMYFSNLSIAQPNLPKKWRVGYFGEIDFTGPVGIPQLSQDTIPTIDSNAQAWDSLGNPIIHTNGIMVADANMDTMPNGSLVYNSILTLPEYGSNLTNGSIILPRPGYTNQYMLFHMAFQITGTVGQIYWGELFYSIVDLNQNNGLGVITNTNNVLLEDSLWVGYVNAVQHGNGRDWWLVCGKNYSNIIYTWLVQPDTIIGPFSQQVGLPLTWPQALNQTQFSPDGNKLAIAYYEHSGQTRKLMLTDFNRCTGQITNPLTLVLNANDPIGGDGVTGVEFSASGRFLYTSSATFLYQFDLLSTNIQNSRILVKTHDHVFAFLQTAFSQLKRGPDNKIYMATGGNHVIDVINYPDSLGVACDVQLRQINYYAQFGATYAMNINVMPNYPDYYLGALVGSGCDTLTGLTNFEHSGQSVTIFPNPTTGTITINFNEDVKNSKSLELINNLGQLVYRKELSKLTKTNSVQIPQHISNGIYTLRIIFSDKTSFTKLVIERE